MLQKQMSRELDSTVFESLLERCGFAGGEVRRDLSSLHAHLLHRTDLGASAIWHVGREPEFQITAPQAGKVIFYRLPLSEISEEQGPALVEALRTGRYEFRDAANGEAGSLCFKDYQVVIYAE